MPTDVAGRRDVAAWGRTGRASRTGQAEPRRGAPDTQSNTTTAPISGRSSPTSGRYGCTAHSDPALSSGVRPSVTLKSTPVRSRYEWQSYRDRNGIAALVVAPEHGAGRTRPSDPGADGTRGTMPVMTTVDEAQRRDLQRVTWTSSVATALFLVVSAVTTQVASIRAAVPFTEDPTTRSCRSASSRSSSSGWPRWPGRSANPGGPTTLR